MKRHFHDMTEEEQTQHIRRRRVWTWSSALGVAGSIAAVLIAWPQISGFIHWGVSMMDAVDNIRQVQETQLEMKNDMVVGFSNVNSNLTKINWRLSVIENKSPRNNTTDLPLLQTNSNPQLVKENANY